MNINNLIIEINRNIFDYKIEDFNQNVILLYDYIQNIIPNLDENSSNYLLTILSYLEKAYKDKDYLLYSDIIEFELKTIL